MKHIEIVVARYNEDTSWLVPYLEHGIHITVYNKGPEFTHDPRITVLPLPNIGREAHTYLHHVCRNYNSLADVTIFIQGCIEDHVASQ